MKKMNQKCSPKDMKKALKSALKKEKRSSVSADSSLGISDKKRGSKSLVNDLTKTNAHSSLLVVVKLKKVGNRREKRFILLKIIF